MIEVSDLVVDIDGKRIIHNLSFKIYEGDRVAIIGPSGEGKSVLLKSLLGLIRPTEGKVLIDGIDIHKAEGDELEMVRSKIGVLFQGSALFDFMTVGSNVGFPLDVHSNLSKKEIVREVRKQLNLVGLKDSYDKMPDELSGGMQKRVALARAIITRPKYMFFDEPTSGLDPVSARVINDLIASVSSQFKLTAVTITHDIASLPKVGEKILFLFKKSIMYYGENRDISQHRELSDFINGRGFID